MRYRSPDFWSGLALAALGAYIINEARGWDYLGSDGPGPGFFPLWYGIAILVLATVLAFGSASEKGTVDWRGSGRALATWAAFAAAVAVLKLVGFGVSVAALTFFIVALMYRRPPAVAALVAAGVVAGFYLVFPLALGVPLP